jgi:cytochrome P450
MAGVSLIPLLTVGLVVPLLSLLLLATRRTSSRPPQRADGGRRLLPPSPPGALPLIGHLHLLGRLPHRALRSLAASHGPVVLLRIGRAPTVVASSAAAAEEALRTRDAAFASRPRALMADRLVYGSRDITFAPYGEYWRQARRVCVVHLLSHRRVASFRRVREQEAAALVARVRAAAAAGGGGGGGAAAVVNLSDALISYSNAVVSRAALGEEDYGLDGDSGGEKLRRVFADLQELLIATPMREVAPWLGWVDTLTGLEARTERTFQAIDGLLERVIADHRARREAAAGGGRVEGDDDHRDFVDVLLDVKDTDKGTGLRLDVDSIKAIIMDMFFAGTDTSYTLLEWAMAELINHPQEMRKLQGEIRAAAAAAAAGAGTGNNVSEDHLDGMPYLKAVISETLRLHAPAPLMAPHETTEDTELLGYHVPARTRVIVNAWAIGRDPELWERAEEFVPERFAAAAAGDAPVMDYAKVGQDMRFLAFGAGRRGCPGAGFAAPSVELALANLLCHFDWELATTRRRRTTTTRPPVLDMSEAFGLSTRLKQPLLLVAKPWSGK